MSRSPLRSPGESIDPLTSIYYTIADRDLYIDGLYGQPISIRRAQQSLALHLLFYDRIVIPDGASLYNPALRSLALDAQWRRFGFGGFLEAGIVRWARRSNTATFAELHEFMAATNSWNVEESQQVKNFLDFLDDKCTLRAVYNYDNTGTLFTNLTSSCLENSDLTRDLQLSSVANRAHRYSEKYRLRKDDGYARRTAIYDFAARLDQRGASRQARRLRQLSSVLYHGSAAHNLGLQLAYPSQYREALGSLYKVAVPEFTRSTEMGPVILEIQDETEIKFYSHALSLVDSDVIKDVRRSKNFAKYKRALAGVSKDPNPTAVENFEDSLIEYVDYLNVPLGALLADRYVEWRRKRNAAKVTKYFNRGGAAFVALLGAAEPNLGLMGLGISAVWSFGGLKLTNWLDRRVEKEAINARSLSFDKPFITIATSKLRNSSG